MPVFDPSITATTEMPLDAEFRAFMSKIYPSMTEEDELAAMKDAFMAGAVAMQVAFVVESKAGAKNVESALIKMNSYLSELRAYALLRTKEAGWRK